MMSTENAAIARRYFSETEEPDKWKCKYSEHLIERKDCAWRNLINHIKSQHPEYATEGDPQQTSMASYLVTNTGHKIGRSAMNVHGWIEWVCQKLKPFSFVEDPLTRKYTKLGSMARPTLLKYPDLLTKEVEEIISKSIPNQFFLAIDGWSKGSTHFVRVFAAYTEPNEKWYSSVFLSFSPMVDENSFTAQDPYEHLTYVFSVYMKTFENVVAITGDNVATNKRIADRCGVKFDGCASHRLNVAVSTCLERHGPLLEKVNTYGKTGEPEVGRYTSRTYKHETHPKKQNSLVEHNGHGWEVNSTEAIPGVSKQRSETCWHASHTEKKQWPW